MSELPRIVSIPRRRRQMVDQCSKQVVSPELKREEAGQTIYEGVSIPRVRFRKARAAGLNPLQCLRFADYWVDGVPYCKGHTQDQALAALLRHSKER